MAQERNLVSHPEITPALQQESGHVPPPKRIVRRYVRIKIPKFILSLPESLFPPKPKKKPIDYVLDRLASMDLLGQSYVEEYLRHQYRRNFKLGTMRGSLKACELFLTYLKGQGKTELCEINRQDLEGFVEQEMDRGLTIVTVRTRLVCIYAFLRFLYEKDIVDADLLVKKIKLRMPSPLPRAINPDDVKKLLSVLDDVRDRAMILVLLRTGMRIGELLNTRIGDANLPERKIAIWEAEKNSVGRMVCISDDAANALEDWLRQRSPDKDLLFYGMGRSSLSYQGARSLFVRYLKKAGLMNKGYTLHCLRHTFASEALNAGMRLEAVQVLLGHSDAEVTRRYARLTDKTREKEYFKAMKRIQRGDIDGDYRLDS
jgi:site-specific recombinase XerD